MLAFDNSCQRYATYRNKMRDATGKLFEERIRSFPIMNDEKLAVTTAYVELNPVRAGLVTNPADYEWSTCRHHVGDSRPSAVPRELWTPSCWYDALGHSVGERVVSYRAWLAARDEEHRVALASGGADDARASEFDGVLGRITAGEQPYRRRLERPDRTRAT